MQLISKKVNQWLLPAVLILFILQVVTLPYVLGFTYSGRSESPDHILTYTRGKLTWDSATDIDANGVAELDLFDANYQNVESSNGDNLVAPGTEGINIVRLKNSVKGPVTYTAVLYRIRTDETLPVETEFADDTAFTDTTTYSLPKGVTKDQVIRAVKGTVKGGQIQDFDIKWLWEFYVDDTQDVADTAFGDKATDEVTVGIYIVVEDNNNYSSGKDPEEEIPDGPVIYYPAAPKTGDNAQTAMYLTLMGISFAVLVVLLIERRREKQCK